MSLLAVFPSEKTPVAPVEALLFSTVYEFVVFDSRFAPERPQGTVAREARL